MTSVLNETDIYREFAPPPSMRGAVACFWARRGNGAPVLVLPDTCSDIVWRPGEEPLIAGPDTRAWPTPTRPEEMVVGARLLPGAGGPAFGLPLTELRNQRVSLSELGLDPSGELAGAMSPAEALRAVVALTARLLAADGGAPDRAVQAAAVCLLDPAERVDRLAGQIGLSERQLRRRFLAAVGYGPKTLQRVVRLRRFLAAAPAELAAAAAEAGYADQSHLTRECQALTGLSPRALLARTTLA